MMVVDMKGRTRILALMCCALFLIAPFASFAVTAKPESRMPSGNTTTHIVLGELITGTWCGWCRYAEQAYDKLINDTNYFDKRLVMIEWHGGDAYAIGETTTRYNYYAGAGYPCAVFDGKDKMEGAANDGTGNYTKGTLNAYKQIIDARPATDPAFLEINSHISGNTLTAWVNATLLQDTTKSQFKVWAVLIEDENHWDGAYPIRMTARAKIFSTAVNIAKKGETGRGTATVNLDASWTVNKLYVVGFLQADSDKEVLQAGINYRTANGPPVLKNAAPKIIMNEDTTDSSVNLDDMFMDVEGDTINYFSAVGSTHINASVDPTTHVLTLQPWANWYGSEDISLAVADTLSCPSDAKVTVQVNPVDDAPVRTKAMPAVSMLEGSTKANAFNLNGYFSDIDDATLTYTASGGQHVNTTIKATGDVTFVSPVGFSGVDTVTFTAKDSGSLTATGDVKVTVSDVNFAPKQSKPIPDITMNEDSVDKSIALNTYFSDVDNPALTYSIDGLTNVVAVIGTDSVITIAPKADWNGIETATLTATDTVNKPLYDTFTITVNPVNDAPTLTATGFETPKFDEDKDYTTEKTVNTLFADIDGPALTYSLDPGNNDLTITLNDDYTITFHPAANWNGEKTYWIKATDGQYTVQYNASVTVQAINDPPHIDTFTPVSPSMTINEGEQVDFNIVASDIPNEGETLVYTWSSNSKVVGENAASYKFMTDSTSAGKYTIVVSVSDGELKDSHTWSVTVKNVNRKPTALITAPGASDVLKSDTPITFSANGSDPDSDTLTYQWSIDGTSVGSGPSVTTMVAAGTHTVKVVVADPNGGSVEATTSITVKKVGGSTGGGGAGSSMLYIALAVVAAVIVVAVVLALVMKGKKKAVPVPPTEATAQVPPPPPQTQPNDPGQGTYGQYQQPLPPPPPQYGGYQGPPPQY
jgi:hypothetical protein